MADNLDIQAAMGRIVNRLKETVCAKYAVQAEQTARANASWTDRTGDARRLLTGSVIDEPGIAIGVRLTHRVEYGKYLERDGDGQYAILKPTIESLRADFFGAVNKAMGGK